MRVVTLFEAKTHLSGLVNEILKHGESIAITKHGHPVAILTPPKNTTKSDIKHVLQEMDKLANELKGSGVTLKEIKKMREEGRK